MFCENCGKQLIRGYQFCMECGTPVPPEPEETPEEANAENTEDHAETTERKLPSVEPINNADGALVYCPNCGMHMQTSNVFCEKCGIRLDNSNGQQTPAPVNQTTGAVPLWNAQPQGFGENLSDYSEDELDRINNFMSGNTAPDDFGGSAGGIDEIEALTQQLASFGASASEMPEIGSVHQQAETPIIHHQQEPAEGESRKVEDFSLLEDSMNSYAENNAVSESGLPIIEGGSMDEDPSQDVSLDPYAFVNNVLDGTPAYTPVDPVEEKTSVFTEPVADVPTYEEPAAEAPAYEEPAAEAPAYEEPAAEAPAYEEPAAEAPAYEEPAAEAPAYEEPAAETPAYEEPAAEAPAYEEPAAEAPACEEPAAEAPAYEEPAVEEPKEDFFENEVPFMEEVAPVIEETPAYSPDEEPAPAEEKAPEEEPEAPKGNLVYCRNCGQDMYDTETVCKNCGAPYKGMYVPPRDAPSRKGSEKRSSKKWIPITAAAVVAVGVAAVLIATTTSKPSDNSNIVGNNTLPITSSAPEQTDPVEDVTEPVDTDATESTPIDTVTSDNDAEVISPVDVSKPSSSVSTEEDGSKPSTSVTTPEHTTRTTKNTNTTKTTTKPNTTTRPAATTKATTATSGKPAAVVTSSKVKSLEKDRQAIMDAAAVIAGEVGKIDMFAQNVIYAIDNSSGSEDTARTAYYNRDFAKNMINIIKNGKSSVDNAVSAADPTNKEMKAAYDSLNALKKKYDAYYNYIISPSGKASSFDTDCANYLSSFTSYLSSNLKYTKIITDDYSSGDTAAAYIAAMSDAVTAANNAVSSLTTLQSKITDLGSKKFEGSVVSELSKSSVTKTYANAAAYTMRVKAYTIMLSGAPADYSSALSSLNSANNNLQGLVDSYSMIQENSFSNYKSESSDAISNAKSNVSSVTKAIS